MSPMSDPNRPGIVERPAADGAPAAPPPPHGRPQSGVGNVLAVVAGFLIGGAAGVIGGAFYMGLFGYHWSPPPDAAASPGPAASSMMGMQPGGRGGPPGGPGGPRGPSPKTQLSGLVSKLDVLTEKPLFVKLTDEQRKQVQEQLKGLADADEVSDDDAKARLDKLLDVLKDQKDTFEAAGYRWPGAGPGGPGGPPGGFGQPPPNPFKTEANAGHLKALSERLDKGG
jgi:hypothetical protein